MLVKNASFGPSVFLQRNFSNLEFSKSNCQNFGELAPLLKLWANITWSKRKMENWGTSTGDRWNLTQTVPLEFSLIAISAIHLHRKMGAWSFSWQFISEKHGCLSDSWAWKCSIYFVFLCSFDVLWFPLTGFYECLMKLMAINGMCVIDLWMNDRESFLVNLLIFAKEIMFSSKSTYLFTSKFLVFEMSC